MRPAPSSDEDPEDAGDAGDDEAREGEAEELAPPTAINAPFGRLGAGAGVAYALVGLAGSSLLPIGKVQPECVDVAGSQIVGRILHRLVAHVGDVRERLLEQLLPQLV